MRGLDGKSGIVAGGARGIGAATVRRLVSEGARVVVGDLLVEAAEELAHEIAKAGGAVIAMRLDATDPASQEAIVKRAHDEHGGLDFYHSNLAGGTEGDVDALNCSLDVFDKSVALNAKSHLIATQAALPGMLEAGAGAMIYTGSGAATAGAARQVAYPMTKNAIHALARHVAAKWGRKGIRANVVSPGIVMTEAVAEHLTDEQVAGLRSVTPSMRLGQPDDIAAMVAFLASDDGEWINGQVIHVNGGSQMRD